MRRSCCRTRLQNRPKNERNDCTTSGEPDPWWGGGLTVTRPCQFSEADILAGGQEDPCAGGEQGSTPAPCKVGQGEDWINAVAASISLQGRRQSQRKRLCNVRYGRRDRRQVLNGSRSQNPGQRPLMVQSFCSFLGLCLDSKHGPYRSRLISTRQRVLPPGAVVSAIPSEGFDVRQTSTSPGLWPGIFVCR